MSETNTSAASYVPGAVDEAYSAIESAQSQLETDLSNWNGDYDGPKDRAEERYSNDVREALENLARQAREKGYVDGLKFASETIERQREHMPESEAIDDATVTYLARIADEIARHEPGHDKPANSF